MEIAPPEASSTRARGWMNGGRCDRDRDRQIDRQTDRVQKYSGEAFDHICHEGRQLIEAKEEDRQRQTHIGADRQTDIHTYRQTDRIR